MYYYKEFEKIEDAISFCEERISALEMESELIAGTLEKVQDETAYFEKLKKELNVDANEAIIVKEIDGIEVLFEPSPKSFEEVLKERTKVIEREIGNYRKIKSILENIKDLPWASQLKVSLLISPKESKVLLKLR